MEDKDLTRRQMVQRMALAIGGTLVAPTVLLESCSFSIALRQDLSVWPC